MIYLNHGATFILDDLVSEQRIGNDNDDLIELKKPSQIELHDQMRFLSPHTELQSYAPETEKPGVPHLGLLYDDGKVNLLKTTLSFVYSANGKKTKSPDFKKYEEFVDWHHKVNPQYTRRSLFSLVACTQDATGRHLALYRARMKILIRVFLKRNPNSAWETLISEDEKRQLIFNIELYFHLVQRTVHEPPIAKYCAKRSVLAMSDGSDSLYAISISIIYSYCLKGITRHQASHLCLIPYSAHVNMVNVLWVELTGYAKLLSELAGYLIEMKSLGMEVPPEHVHLASDSMILIKLLRARVTYLQKASSHKVAKILIQMNTLGVNSWDHLSWADQKVVNFFPDHISKQGRTETCKSVLKLYDRLFDFSWLTSGELPHLPGLHANLPEPKAAEMEELQQKHIIQSEWQNFCKEQRQEHDIIALSAAARCDVTCGSSCERSDTKDCPIVEKITPPVPPTDPQNPTDRGFTPPARYNNPDDWKRTLTLLIERRFSYGFGRRGPLGILTKCLQWGIKLRICARLGNTARRERQKRRKEAYLGRTRSSQCLIDPFQQGHNLITKAVDPLNLDFGDLDDHLPVEERLPGDLQVSEDSLQVTESRIFHHMTNSFQARGKVKYFKNVIKEDKYGNEVSLLIGRRQRDLFDQHEDNVIEQTRLRHLEANSTLERFVLWAAHRASFNNLSKAKVSVLSLNIYIVNLEEKLRKLQMTCSQCNLMRGQRHRLDDLIQNDYLGPSSQLFRVKQWQLGRTYHMIDLVGPASTYLANAQNKKKVFHSCLFTITSKTTYLHSPQRLFLSKSISRAT
mgnify:FL=1